MFYFRLFALVSLVATMGITTTALAEPREETFDWRPACDGSRIDVTKEGRTILGISASATHHTFWVHWTLHYIDGKPISAEYRKARIERHHEGDHVGELTGDATLLVVKTWVPSNGRFQIKDKDLAAELTEIIELASSHGKQSRTR